MYKVFVNELPLILTSQPLPNAKGNVFTLDKDSIEYAITSLSKNLLKEAFIYEPGNDILEKFTSKIPMVVAAGGLVKNKKGKILFIFREGKWDLPKGKLDKGESIEAAAIREVEEETGVAQLEVKRYLQTTYHIFRRSGQYRLKKVYWFEMYTAYDGKLIAQEDEGITAVKWKGPKKVEKALKNSYKNIRILFEENLVF
ncbi:MAG: NUDIX domain-containing protein [Bacteroidota bacterium]